MKNKIKDLDSFIQMIEVENYVNEKNNSEKADTMYACIKIIFLLFLLVLLYSGTFFLDKCGLIILAYFGSIAGIVKVHLKKSKNKLINNQKKHKEKIDNKQDFFNKSQNKFQKDIEEQELNNVCTISAFLDKKKINNKILNEIEFYYEKYNLPPITISNEDWNMYISIIYDVLILKGKQDKFYNIMSELNRICLAKSLVNKKKNIEINDYIEILRYINTYVNFKEREILELQKMIIFELKKSTVNKINKFDSSENVKKLNRK